MTTILGINAYHGDVSAALLRHGELVAAVEEERFRRIKHWAGFPREAIRACLELAKVAPTEIDHFAVSRDPRAHLWRKVRFVLWDEPGLGLVRDRLRNRRRGGEIAKWSISAGATLAISRHVRIASRGNPAQCLIRRKRSSSTAATSSPSRRSAAETSPW